MPATAVTTNPSPASYRSAVAKLVAQNAHGATLIFVAELFGVPRGQVEADMAAMIENDRPKLYNLRGEELVENLPERSDVGTKLAWQLAHERGRPVLLLEDNQYWLMHPDHTRQCVAWKRTGEPVPRFLLATLEVIRKTPSCSSPRVLGERFQAYMPMPVRLGQFPTLTRGLSVQVQQLDDPEAASAEACSTARMGHIPKR